MNRRQALRATALLGAASVIGLPEEQGAVRKRI
ncbi:twin-arginine translocation signal domain-containing protein [Rufibacter radiotolerans]